MKTWTTDDIPDLTGRVAVVTGGNGGLGFETSKALAAAHAHVIIAARNPDKAAAAAAVIRAEVSDASLELVELDLADLVFGRAGRRHDHRRAPSRRHPGQQRRPDGHAERHHGRRIRNPVRRQPPRPLGA